MPEIPECLSRRYKALDELIQELNSYQQNNPNAESVSTDDLGIKLMCDFWGILKEDPDVNLTQAVQQRLRAKGVSSGMFGSQDIRCFSCCNNEDKKKEAPKKIKKTSNESHDNKSPCCSSKSTTPSSSSQNNLPLNKVLCNLKEAASFEQKCHGKVDQLLETQKELQQQIQLLEEKEREGGKLLKQADCMWSCMEEAYKKKIAESLGRQNELLKQLKDTEASNGKWRKNKKDLEFQMNNVNKCYQEIVEKINEKTSDIKCIDMEIVNFKKRIESNKTDLQAAKKSFGTKKQLSDAKMSSIAAEVTKLEKKLNDEKKHKLSKEQEGAKYIKEAREELQKLCKVLLQKKLENEDLQAEKEALLLEIEVLIQTCDQCRDKCKNKQESINEEIKAIEKAIAEFKVRCIQCHECTDTADIRKFCTDCPKCLQERNCLIEGDHCNVDHTMDCVCMTVKQKFLDNVFDNMYTSLERQVQSGPGKAVADEVMNCLKKSRNGKLNEGTRKILQDFILTTVKKNLNLTIVGGAVKTRCEMDAETYNQLMICLKQIKLPKPQKTEKGTEAKKEPCKRWGGTNECNCPKGPKACICIKKAPPPVNETSSCPQQATDKDDPGEAVICPHKDSTPCGPDCGMRGVPNAVGSEVAAWRPSPCQGPTCQFKNMRAAQCVLGPEILTSAMGPLSHSSFSPTTSILDDQVACRCSGVAKIPCTCHKDVRDQPRERIIEEVMGRYTDVTPIEKMQGYQMTKVGCNQIDSKQMKVEIPKQCVKETCSAIQKSVPFKPNNKDINQLNIDDTPVQEIHCKLAKSEQKMTVHSDTKLLTQLSPIVTKTTSGDLQIALDKEILKRIDKKLQENPNLFEDLKETDSSESKVKHNSISHTNNKVLAKKTPSGNIILEFDKKFSRKCMPHLAKSTNRGNIESYNKSYTNEKVQKNENLTKLILDTSNKKISGCKKNGKNINKFFKVRVKGSDNKANEVVFVIRQTDSGVYDLILDKEFEKLYLQTIEEHHDITEEGNACARLERTNSGHFIMNFDNNDQEDSEGVNVLLVKSDSGNIKVVISEKSSTTELIKKKFASVLSSQTLSHLLKKIPYSSREFHRENLKKSRMIATKSSSDSNVYGRFKFDIQNNQNLIKSEAVLKKTDSGQYTVVLDKESKNAFISNLKKKISSSSAGLIPIKRTDSGNIIVNLNSDLTSLYGSLKITQSGNIYVLLNKNTNKEITTNTQTFEDKSVDGESKLSEKFEKVIIRTTKATTTSCRGHCEENFCDESKCVCEIKSYGSNEYPTNTLIDEDSNEDSSNNDFNSKDKLTKNLPHIVIKPCGCQPITEKSTTDENCKEVSQSICPYHIGRYQALSNDILEISSLCQRDLDDIKKNEQHVQNTTLNNNKKIDAWDSLEFLPPQLPPFLKDYSLF